MSAALPEAGDVIAGIDVGGTFTDLVIVDGRTGRVEISKVPTTTDDQSRGVLQALAATQCPVSDIGLVIHGTTATTNALLERRLARAGMITTRGFRDVIELGRRTRPNPYGLFGSFTPIIPRNLRLEVTERIEATGRVREPLDEGEVREAVAALLDEGCESLVIHFIHACTNPAHEKRAEEIARDIWPNDYVTTGHSLLSEAREFERGVTASVNASVQPILQRYVERLRTELASGGYGRDYLIMNGNGGTISSRLVANEAAKTVMSGPASGVIAAANAAARSGFDRLITYDMGGTSTDVALIEHGRPMVSNEIEVEYAMPIHVPMVDVRTIGAGGGSIALVNDAGLLQVGPQSAGSTPGPICYGRGGTAPTITDANVLLGRLDPEKLLGVDDPVTIEQIKGVFERDLGAPLGLSAMEAAEAVLQVANLRMAGAIRMVSLAKGRDPRDFALFAFGGGGPMHAAAIARELGIPRVIVPARPGITNAVGCVVADLRHDYVNTINRPVFENEGSDLDAVLEAQRQAGIEALAQEAIRPARIVVERSIDMQFIGQTHLIRVPLPDGPVSLEDVQARFETAYFERFRVRLPEIRANIVNLNTSVIGVRADMQLGGLLPRAARKASLGEALVERRFVTFDGEAHDTPVYDRKALPENATIMGPAILRQLDTTTVIAPGDRAEPDDEGNIVIAVGAPA